MHTFNLLKESNVSSNTVHELEVRLAEAQVELDDIGDYVAVLNESLDHRLDAKYEQVRDQLRAAVKGLEVAKKLKDPTKRDEHVAKVKANTTALEKQLNALRKEQKKQETGFHTNETPRQTKDRTNAVRKRKEARRKAERDATQAKLKADRQAAKEAKKAAAKEARELKKKTA